MIKFLHSIVEKNYSDRRIFILFLVVLASLYLDVSISQVSDLPFIFNITTSFWGVVGFTIISGIYLYGSYAILQVINRRNKEVGIKSFQNKTFFNIVKVVTYLLMLVMLIIVLQIISTAEYYKPLLAISATLSYGLAIFVMAYLAYRLLSWYKISKSLAVLVYGIASICIIVNATSSLVYFDVVLLELRTLMYSPEDYPLNSEGKPTVSEASKGYIVTPQTEVHFETSFSSTKPMYYIGQTQWYSMAAYFISIWAGTVLLLYNNIKRIGIVRFAILTILPISLFLYYYNMLTDPANPINPSQQHTDFEFAKAFLIFAWVIIALGILFGMGFRSIAKKVKDNRFVYVYLMFASYGFAYFINAAQATVIQHSYPPFGLATMSFVGLSSFLIFVGIYHSAISISLDRVLLRSINKKIKKEFELLGNIGTAQLRQTIENSVMKSNKELVDRMSVDTNIQPSLSEDEVKEYVTHVLAVLKKDLENK